MTSACKTFLPLSHRPFQKYHNTLFHPSIVFNFSNKSQEKLKTTILQNFGGKTKSVLLFLNIFEKRLFLRPTQFLLTSLASVTLLANQKSNQNQWLAACNNFPPLTPAAFTCSRSDGFFFVRSYWSE